MKSATSLSGQGGRTRFFFLFLCALFFFLASPGRPAFAIAGCENCDCVSSGFSNLRDYIMDEHQNTRTWIKDQFMKHRKDFFTGYFFHEHVQRAMRLMADEITAAAMLQMNAIGAMMDAENQLETQRLFQEKTARAHKDYHPDMQMCEIGTVSRGLRRAFDDGENAAFALSQRALARQTLNSGVAAAEGPEVDRAARLTAFKKYFCDTSDNNASLKPLCGNNIPGETVNMDVDFARLVMGETLKADFSDDKTSAAESGLNALQDNLFGHRTMPPIQQGLLSDPENQDEILDTRAVIAKRSVALNSFSAIAGMKAAGKGDAGGSYAQAVLRRLDIPEEEIEKLLPQTASYDGLMNLLTKKIYQNPSFYVGLYDKPANVDRKAASLRAIGLMQDMDMFKSRLRNEAMLAVLLELELASEQEAVQNDLNSMEAP